MDTLTLVLLCALYKPMMRNVLCGDVVVVSRGRSSSCGWVEGRPGEAGCQGHMF